MYSALSGAVATVQNLEMISNNLANVNNAGFKKEESHFEALYHSQLQRTFGEGINYNRVSRMSTDFSQGDYKRTDGKLDLAIEGEGFFKVAGEDGFLYTRKGNFQLQEDGSLVTPSGHQVVGENGPISLPTSQVTINQEGSVQVTVDRDGTIQGENGSIGRISVYDVPDRAALEKRGDNLWSYRGQGRDSVNTDANLRQGYLETSNVEPMREMTELIRTKRLFQAYQKNLKAYGDMAKQANEIGRIS
jgi:flagellar basal-body rod protein FlgF